jgi:hypothetical protein
MMSDLAISLGQWLTLDVSADQWQVPLLAPELVMSATSPFSVQSLTLDVFVDQWDGRCRCWPPNW